MRARQAGRVRAFKTLCGHAGQIFTGQGCAGRLAQKNGCQPQQYAQAAPKIVSMCGDDGCRISGQRMRVDGGDKNRRRRRIDRRDLAERARAQCCPQAAALQVSAHLGGFQRVDPGIVKALEGQSVVLAGVFVDIDDD